jgi:hypothetical protein
LTAAGAEAIRTLQVNLDIVDLNYLSGQIPTFTADAACRRAPDAVIARHRT